MILKDTKNHTFVTSNSLQSFFIFYKKMKSGRNNYLKQGSMEGWDKQNGRADKRREGGD